MDCYDIATEALSSTRKVVSVHRLIERIAAEKLDNISVEGYQLDKYIHSSTIQLVHFCSLLKITAEKF